MNSNTLTNPNEEDFSEEEQVKNDEEVIYSKDQLSFNVETPNEKLVSIVSGLKMNLKKQEELLEISQLWKSPAPALFIVSLLTILVILIIGGLINYNNIGPTIPLFFDSVNKQFIATDKLFIFFSAVAVGVIEVLAFRFMVLISKDDRRLSVVMCWILFFINILILAAIGQFYTIVI